jgi:hypothetical protein
VRRWSATCYFFSQKFILYEIQLIDQLVVGSFEPPHAREASDGICRHFSYESYLLKVWWFKTHSYLSKKSTSVKVSIQRVPRTPYLRSWTIGTYFATHFSVQYAVTGWPGTGWSGLILVILVATIPRWKRCSDGHNVPNNLIEWCMYSSTLFFYFKILKTIIPGKTRCSNS